MSNETCPYCNVEFERPAETVVTASGEETIYVESAANEAKYHPDCYVKREREAQRRAADNRSLTEWFE